MKRYTIFILISFLLASPAYARGSNAGDIGGFFLLIILIAFIGLLIYAIAKKMNGGRSVDNGDYAVAMIVVFFIVTVLGVAFQ